MSLPHRLGSALFPATSVYADLDNSPEPFPDEPVGTRSASSSADTRPGHHDGQRAPDGSRLADDDPFSAVTPSVLSPASARNGDAQLHRPPHFDQRANRQDVDGSGVGRAHDGEDDERDPFAADTSDISPRVNDSRSLSPTPTGSLYLPAQGSPQQHPRTPSTHAPSTASVASSSRTRTSSATGGSKSAIGNRSLMGLLGGTRYEGGGFAFGGIGVGEVEEEDEGEDEEERVGMRHEEQGHQTPRKCVTLRSRVSVSRRLTKGPAETTCMTSLLRFRRCPLHFPVRHETTRKRTTGLLPTLRPESLLWLHQHPGHVLIRSRRHDEPSRPQPPRRPRIEQGEVRQSAGSSARHTSGARSPA